MDALEYLYLHAPQMIQITGIALLIAGCIPAVGLPRRTARTVSAIAPGVTPSFYKTLLAYAVLLPRLDFPVFQSGCI